jgi:hypothetical protein
VFFPYGECEKGKKIGGLHFCPNSHNRYRFKFQAYVRLCQKLRHEFNSGPSCSRRPVTITWCLSEVEIHPKFLTFFVI